MLDTEIKQVSLLLVYFFKTFFYTSIRLFTLSAPPCAPIFNIDPPVYSIGQTISNLTLIASRYSVTKENKFYSAARRTLKSPN